MTNDRVECEKIIDDDDDDNQNDNDDDETISTRTPKASVAS